MTSLPFTLRVPDKDAFSLSRLTSTKYRFQGRLRLTGSGLDSLLVASLNRA